MTSPKIKTGLDQDVQHLFRAVRKGKAHLTRFMLAASNNSLLNCWNTEGRTPLIESCYIKEESTRGHMVRLLKDAGADVNMTDITGKTALIHACEQKCNDVVKILIQHANICPDVEDMDGNTALIHSANAGNDIALEMIVKSFRRLGLNVDHFNKAGYTALHVATTSRYLHCAKVLAIKGKASLTLKDRVHDMTPLEWCLNEGYQKSEVEFLKPSAKFYRLAKLTTTMAKYRKKSTQENLPESETHHMTQFSEPSEKPKSKVKGFLRKVKTSSANGADNDAVTDNNAFKSNKPFDETSNEINFTFASLDISKSHFPGKSVQRKAWDNSRQRSLSQLDQQEGCQEIVVAAEKTGLPHSRSHPVTTRDFEIDTTGHGKEKSIPRERFAHVRNLNLNDDYGETDYMDTFLSDTDSSFQTSDEINQDRDVFCQDGIFFGETLTNESPEKGIDESVNCDNPVQVSECSIFPNKAVYSSMIYSAPLSETSEVFYCEKIPCTAFNFNTVTKSALPNMDHDKEAFIDIHQQFQTETPQQTTLPFQKSNKYKAILMKTKMDAESTQHIRSQFSRPISGTGHINISVCEESNEYCNMDGCFQTSKEESMTKNIIAEKDKINNGQRIVTMRTVQSQTKNISVIRDANKTQPEEISKGDRNNKSLEPAGFAHENVLSQPVFDQPSNFISSCKINKNIQAQKVSINNLSSQLVSVSMGELSNCETKILKTEKGTMTLQETWTLATERKFGSKFCRAFSELLIGSTLFRRSSNECAFTQAKLEYLDLIIPVNYSQQRHDGLRVSNDVIMTMGGGGGEN